MGKGLLFCIVFFVVFYTLFWNINKWKWSTIKILLMSIGCSIITSVVLSGFIFVLYLIG